MVGSQLIPEFQQLEERAMPMIARILSSLQTLPGTVFIFFIF
jgi:hypothetical protein